MNRRSFFQRTIGAVAASAVGRYLPLRVAYEPPLQALELGAEAARRAIKAAMGIPDGLRKTCNLTRTKKSAHSV